MPVVTNALGEKLSKQSGAQAIDELDPLAALRTAGAHLGLASHAQSVDSWLSDATAGWAALPRNLAAGTAPGIQDWRLILPRRKGKGKGQLYAFQRLESGEASRNRTPCKPDVQATKKRPRALFCLLRRNASRQPAQDLRGTPPSSAASCRLGAGRPRPKAAALLSVTSGWAAIALLLGS
ncbi:hypothetical protein ACU4GD_19775 [Cupriavidus basilensis]